MTSPAGRRRHARDARTKWSAVRLPASSSGPDGWSRPKRISQNCSRLRVVEASLGPTTPDPRGTSASCSSPRRRTPTIRVPGVAMSWINESARHCAFIDVVTMRAGRVAVAGNVRMLSVVARARLQRAARGAGRRTRPRRIVRERPGDSGISTRVASQMRMKGMVFSLAPPHGDLRCPLSSPPRRRRRRCHRPSFLSPSRNVWHGTSPSYLFTTPRRFFPVSPVTPAATSGDPSSGATDVEPVDARTARYLGLTGKLALGRLHRVAIRSEEGRRESRSVISTTWAILTGRAAILPIPINSLASASEHVPSSWTSRRPRTHDGSPGAGPHVAVYPSAHGDAMPDNVLHAIGALGLAVLCGCSSNPACMRWRWTRTVTGSSRRVSTLTDRTSSRGASGDHGAPWSWHRRAT